MTSSISSGNQLRAPIDWKGEQKTSLCLRSRNFEEINLIYTIGFLGLLTTCAKNLKFGMEVASHNRS